MFSQFSFGSKCLGTPVPDWIFLPAIKYDWNLQASPELQDQESSAASNEVPERLESGAAVTVGLRSAMRV
jgi:hypothetical protein